MPIYSKWLSNFLYNWPGKKRFGVYRFLPAFFFMGAALEFTMIKWQVGETNFYKTFKRRRAQEIVDQQILNQQNSISL